MKQLSYKLFLLSLILILSVLGLNEIFINKSFPYDYTGGMLIDKHKIAQNTPSPKVLIIGGSSGSFGINSKILEEQIQPFSVVNMSFIAPFGTYFLFNDALKEVKKNDKIFVTIEYDIEHFGSTNVLLSAADYYPDAENYAINRENLIYNVRDKVNQKIKNVRQLFFNILKKDHRITANNADNTSVYFRKAFSEKGDIISHLNNPPKAINFQDFPKEFVNYSLQIKDLNLFVEKAKLINAEVYFIFPPLAKSTYLYGKIAVESISQQLKKDIHCQILGNEKDFIMPDSLFFDSFYHLNAQGRDLRTHKIIELYKNIQKDSLKINSLKI